MSRHITRDKTKEVSKRLPSRKIPELEEFKEEFYPTFKELTFLFIYKKISPVK